MLQPAGGRVAISLPLGALDAAVIFAPMIAKAVPSEFERIAAKVLDGARITFDEGVWLIEHAPVHELAVLAHTVRNRKMEAAGR